MGSQSQQRSRDAPSSFIQPLPQGQSQIHPGNPYLRDHWESDLGTLQNAHVDFLLRALQYETQTHNDTRSREQLIRSKLVQLERINCTDRSEIVRLNNVAHTLQEQKQNEILRRISAESKLQACHCKQGQDLGAFPVPETPLSDYRSATTYNSIQSLKDPPPSMKRKNNFSLADCSESKRSRSLPQQPVNSPRTPSAMKMEAFY